jgi:hypothetical protein
MVLTVKKKLLHNHGYLLNSEPQAAKTTTPPPFRVAICYHDDAIQCPALPRYFLTDTPRTCRDWGGVRRAKAL